MSFLLYRFVLHPLLIVAMRLASVASPSVRAALRARASGQRLGRPADAGDARLRVLVHAASVGEFEQARPIIEALQTEPDRYHITASFSSPSGFVQQGRVGSLDAVEYLPIDRGRDVRAFLDRVRPELVLVVRYDLWPVFVREADRRRIPVVLVCGVLRRSSKRFLPAVRRLFAETYGRLSLVHCVSDDDARAFAELAPDVPVEVSGDTRYDRVLERAQRVDRDSLTLKRPRNGLPVLVAGSTWPEDERLLVQAAQDLALNLVLVPHEPTADHVADLRQRVPDAATLSELETSGRGEWDGAVIVDRTGVLMSLYALADIAYVGGAFGAGVHSVLEPAAYAVPVISGPRVDRSRDAAEMRDRGLLSISRTADDLGRELRRLLDASERARLASEISAFVTARSGATPRILSSLRRHGLLDRPPRSAR